MQRLLTLFVLTASLAAVADPCAEKTKEGEALVDKGDMAGAVAPLETAVAQCRKDATFKSARPFIALGKAYYELKRFQDAIPLFEEALKYEKGLPLAYMNLGAAYMELEQFDKSVEWLQKGLAQKELQKDWTMKLNYNAGLAYFKLAAAKNDEKDERSEPFFKKAAALGPSFGGSFFYLGVLAEVVHKDRKAAEGFYKQGCEKKYDQACQYLASIDSRMTAPRAPAAAATGGKLSAANEKLMERITAGDKKMGADQASIDTVVTNLRNACGQAGEGPCKAMLENTVAALK